VAIATINPATGETAKTFDEMSEADVERCLADATTAFASYRLTSFDQRAGCARPPVSSTPSRTRSRR
jgi:succinate-semialdehyde dehydrogenase / glutarate-semialdehyde dehydrogenase